MRDPSPTLRLDLAVRVDLRLDRDPGLDPVDLEAPAADPVDLVGLHRAVPGVPAGRVVLRPVGRVVLLDLVRTRRPGQVLPLGRVVLDLAVPVVPDRLRPVGLGLMDRVELVVPVDLDRVGRAALLDLADRVVPGLTVLVVPVVLGLMGRVSLAVPVVPVDPRRCRIGPEVSTIAAVPSLAAPGTRRTASAHPTTVRRLHPRNAGSAGMTDPLPEGLRPTGMGRRLRAVGTVLRLPVAGTVDGTGRHAT